LRNRPNTSKKKRNVIAVRTAKMAPPKMNPKSRSWASYQFGRRISVPETTSKIEVVSGTDIRQVKRAQVWMTLPSKKKCDLGKKFYGASIFKRFIVIVVYLKGCNRGEGLARYKKKIGNN